MKALAFTVLLVGLSCSVATARCTDATEARFAARAWLELLRCEEERAFDDPAIACPAPTIPSCAASSVEPIRELLFGAVGTVASDERTPTGKCQRQIRRAGASYLRKRFRGRVLDRRAAPRKAFLKRIARRCEGVPVETTAGGRVPAVGDVCESIVAGAGSVDAQGLGRCLSARLEAILDDVAPAPLKPSILVVLTDDQRRENLADLPLTVDRLQHAGIQFQNAFATTASCAPSRASFFSGQYAHNHGLLSGINVITGVHSFDHEGHLPAWLKADGYRTALFGKYLNNALALGEVKPPSWDEWQIFITEPNNFFDYQLNVNGSWVDMGSRTRDYSTDHLAREAERFLRSNREEPFFLMYSPYAPHEPATPAPRHDGTFASIPPWRPPNFREPDVSDKPVWVQFMSAFAEPDLSIGDEFRIDQLESLQSVDEAVDELMQTLDDTGLTDNTIVLFLSDQGIHLGEHWWYSKFTGYEESIRVPMVVQYPRRYPLGWSEDGFVRNIDLAPTLADWAGVTPIDIDGTSLSPLLDGISPGPTDVLIENFEDFVVKPNQSVRTDTWKYIATSDVAGVVEELYDLTTDPFELTNLADSPAHATIKAALAVRLAELLAQ